MKKQFITAVQVAQVISQNPHIIITSTSISKRMLENGIEMSANSAGVALNKMVALGAISKVDCATQSKKYRASKKTLPIIMEVENQRIIKHNKGKAERALARKELKKVICKKPSINKDKVFWGDKIMGVGTVFISGVRE
jgi:Fe2+ or Zn2+ uptake regulation protein